VIGVLRVVCHHCLFLSVHVSASVERKAFSFSPNKNFLHCMEPEASLPCIILKNKIKILRSLKSGRTDFKDFNIQGYSK
jgi:hypothetical protein